MIDIILIASYGCEDNIENLILKLLDQKNTNIIFVDNACKKKGSEILKFYASKYKSPLVKNNNYSIKLAKERGLARANNDYICFISGNDEIKDDFFKEIFDKNYDIIIPGDKDEEITTIDFVSEKVSSSFYGKIIKRDLLLYRTPLNYEEKEAFYKFDAQTKIYQKKTNKYKHVKKELLRKEFSGVYNDYAFCYDQYKFFEKQPDIKKVAIEKMINYGNIAYAKMMSNKDRYKVELNNIKNCYISLKNNCNAKFDKKIVEKIKNGKFTEDDLNVQKFKIIKNVNKKLVKIIENIKPNIKNKKKIKIKK